MYFDLCVLSLLQRERDAFLCVSQLAYVRVRPACCWFWSCPVVALLYQISTTSCTCTVSVRMCMYNVLCSGTWYLYFGSVHKIIRNAKMTVKRVVYYSYGYSLPVFAFGRLLMFLCPITCCCCCISCYCCCCCICQISAAIANFLSIVIDVA